MKSLTTKSNRICCLLIFILLFSSSFLFSENNLNVIKGRLISEKTALPVAFVNIIIKETGEGCSSNTDGEFKLQVEKLPITLQISHIGYHQLTIKADRTFLSDIKLTPKLLYGDEVLVTASRAVEGKTPVAFTTLDRQSIERSYYHQDVPMVLNEMPGVYSYSDAGNGVGYSYIKIRGFSQDRIGVMLNGIPLNDPEAHAVYWVDHGDILNSISNIQVQRGVGNSLYGTSVFGGSINLVTGYQNLRPGLTFRTGYGNYTDDHLDLPSRKYSLSYVGGPWQEKGLNLYSRISNLSSSGYRIESGTDQKSFHVGLEKNSENSLTRAEIIYGESETAFSWEGVSPAYGYDLENRSQRRYNYYADPEWNGGLNDANKDIFKQSIISLHHSRKLFTGLMSITLYNVKGSGYYEQFKGGRDVTEYNLTQFLPDSIKEVDLLRRKWLRNGYNGFVYQYAFPFRFGEITIGGDSRFYYSEHFGRVKEIFGDWQIPEKHNYYFDNSNKNSNSFYIHSYLNFTEKIITMADFRYLGHRYQFEQDSIGAFVNSYNYKLKYDFFDLKFGIYYKLNNRISVFGSISTASREPTDGDLYDHDDPDDIPKVKNMVSGYATPIINEERLVDYEVGLKIKGNVYRGQINFYRMDFRNELIPAEYRYYDADDVLHANAKKTIHQGIEIDTDLRLFDWLKVSGNITYSDNHFVKFRADSIGWSGWGGIADYSQKTIPAFPAFQSKGKLIIQQKNFETWVQALYVGKQYIDFANTEDAAIDPYAVVNIGTALKLPEYFGVKSTLNFRIDNLFNNLYETFGYNYYESWGRVDLYWPAATRNYYVMLILNF